MRIEHMAMYTADLEKAKEFYTHYFGGTANEKYTNSHTGFSSYFIRFSDGSRLELMNQPQLAVSDGKIKTGYAHIAFSVGTEEKVVSLTERLRNGGFKVLSEPRTTGDGYFESCIADFEGNRIEITI